MKNSFLAKRGRVWHIVHETKTGLARTHAWTLCGLHFEEGERGGRRPTCENCLHIDNPYNFTPHMKRFIRDIIRIPTWKDVPAGETTRKLVQADIITPRVAKAVPQVRLTRRGAILAEDWTIAPVPLPDAHNIMHARSPLSFTPKCAVNFSTSVGTFPPLAEEYRLTMTIERYAKLRAASDNLVTCLQCLSMDD